jgi:hypothetical protein
MIMQLLLLASAGVVIYLAISPALHNARTRREERLRERFQRNVAAIPGSRSAGKAPGAASAAGRRAEGGHPSVQKYQDDDGNWVEVMEQSEVTPFGSISITSSTTTQRMPMGGLLDGLLANRVQFPVTPAADLPTFADVGGMESFKQEVRETS